MLHNKSHFKGQQSLPALCIQERPYEREGNQVVLSRIMHQQARIVQKEGIWVDGKVWSEEHLEACLNSTWLRPGWREIGIEGGNTYNYQVNPRPGHCSSHNTCSTYVHPCKSWWRHGQDYNSSLCPDAINICNLLKVGSSPGRVWRCHLFPFFQLAVKMWSKWQNYVLRSRNLKNKNSGSPNLLKPLWFKWWSFLMEVNFCAG